MINKEINEARICGLYIKPKNTIEMANAVMKLFADFCLAEFLDKKGREYVVEVFDQDKLATGYLEIIAGYISPAASINGGIIHADE